MGPDAGSDAPVAALVVPGEGQYVIVASVTLGNSAALPNLVDCELRRDGAALVTGIANLSPLAVLSQTLALTAAGGGGAVTLTCMPGKGAQGRSPVITAVRVGSLQAQ